MELFPIYELVQATCNCLLIFCYSITLTKNICGSRFAFVMKILVMLLVCNICELIIIVADRKQKEAYETLQTSNIILWGCWIEGVATFFKYATFNVAHWIFAFEYFSIARTIPFVIRARQVPDSLI